MVKKLNENQKRAVEYLSGPLLVLAGPGTGKTQLLSEKVAYILNSTDTNPENILCMTFTESGVQNMRERLRTTIGAAGARVKVSTYHAFGSDILAEYKNYSEDYDRILDENVDQVTQYKIIKEIQGRLPGNDILRGDNVKNIVAVISAAKSAGLQAEDLQKIAETNLADSKVLSEQISPLLKNIVPRKFRESFDGAYGPIFELLKNYLEADMIVGNIERSIGVLARDLKTAILEAESSEKIKPLTSWKDKYFEKDARGNYRLRDRVANLKLASTAKVMKKYSEYLNENGLFDFNDMIQEAIRILKKDAGFRATLSERYQFIMLDEFQDTNPSQFAIIKELTDYENPLIMAVGDDDQAIYEFQGALSTNLTDFQEYYGAEVIALTENYRSTQEILDFSHDVIAQATDRFADKELTAHRPDPETSQIYRYEFLSSDMEYSFVADKIAELIKAGVPQDEIAVISYKHKYFMPLLPYLKSHSEIKIAYERRDDLFEDEKIHQILTMAEYIYELANEKRVDTSVLEIMGYPFWKLPVVEVLRLTEAARKNKHSAFEEICKSANEEIRQVGEFFAAMSLKSFTEPLEIWIDELIGATEVSIQGKTGEKQYRSPFLKYYTGQDYETFSLYENLSALKNRIIKHFGEKALRLADLIEMVRDYKQADMSLTAKSPYRDADKAVQILSAHSAKGLEFRYVFIISADHTAWGKGKGNNTTLSLPKNMMQIHHTGTMDGEKLRILYVSLTRAKEFLYITNSLKDFNDKSPERLEYFQEYSEGDEVFSAFLPDKKVRTEYSFKKNDALTEGVKRWFQPYIEATADMRAIYKERVKNYRMSASSLTSFIDIVYAGPQAFFRDYILRAPREPETESLAFGNLIHAVFEATTNKNLGLEAAMQMFMDELDKRDLTEEIKSKIRDKGPEDLKISFEAFSDILHDGRAEVDFAAEKMTINGVPVTGKIDHIRIDEKNKEIEVYDFKTSKFYNKKWQSHATLYKYMLQLEFYKLLLNNSIKYRDYKVTQAHILFVTPDKDGEVYDKVYEYNSEDEKGLKVLMEKIYNKITTLEFMEDPSIFIEADQRKGVSDIKDFVMRLIES